MGKGFAMVELWRGVGYESSLTFEDTFIPLAIRPVFVLPRAGEGEWLQEAEELAADIVVRSGAFTPALAEFLYGDEHDVTKETALSRVTSSGRCAGKPHALAMLKNPELIPEEYRRFVVLVMGTIWLSGDNRKIMCLFWNGFRWAYCFDYLSADFDREYRVLVWD